MGFLAWNWLPSSKPSQPQEPSSRPAALDDYSAYMASTLSEGGSCDGHIKEIKARASSLATDKKAIGSINANQQLASNSGCLKPGETTWNFVQELMLKESAKRFSKFSAAEVSSSNACARHKARILDLGGLPLYGPAAVGALANAKQRAIEAGCAPEPSRARLGAVKTRDELIRAAEQAQMSPPAAQADQAGRAKPPEGAGFAGAPQSAAQAAGALLFPLAPGNAERYVAKLAANLKEAPECAVFKRNLLSRGSGLMTSGKDMTGILEAYRQAGEAGCSKLSQPALRAQPRAQAPSSARSAPAPAASPLADFPAPQAPSASAACQAAKVKEAQAEKARSAGASACAAAPSASRRMDSAYVECLGKASRGLRAAQEAVQAACQ